MTSRFIRYVNGRNFNKLIVFNKCYCFNQITNGERTLMVNE